MSSSSSSSSSKIISLLSSDGKLFKIKESVASQSQLIKHMIEDGCINTAIPLPKISSKILSKVIEFCEKHDSSAEDLKIWDECFVKVLDQFTLFDLILAANYLEINSLLDVTCEAVAGMIRGKNAKELQLLFNIENDFPPEEKNREEREMDGKASD